MDATAEMIIQAKFVQKSSLDNAPGFSVSKHFGIWSGGFVHVHVSFSLSTWFSKTSGYKKSSFNACVEALAHERRQSLQIHGKSAVLATFSSIEAAGIILDLCCGFLNTSADSERQMPHH
ncbi:hypothetical protein NOR_08172 [Metarhizium rileyi]|uniref:Uncharacterized protein n=1 Tax=Metarhizium rileyi (strain RCEF 4871) TaxID=1649241 RepID=A0A166WNQ2_METRR|nr:hypothetical protein NOR_08172 [Metarhizium rileyi RCEF 4871]